MSLSLFVRKAVPGKTGDLAGAARFLHPRALTGRFARGCVVLVLLTVTLPRLALSQGLYVTNGTEYAVAGSLPGDQDYPAVAVTTNGGYLVWQDNITDGEGFGISALRLDNNGSGYLSPFRVNQIGAGQQIRPQVALLKNGGAAFVWQGGRLGFQHIYARFLSSSNTWLVPTDLMVNTFTANAQISPAIATLANGNLVVVWGSFNQANSNSLQDVYGQILSPTGQKVGGEFQVNQFTPFNQRSPAVAALKNGGFVVAWVTEQQTSGPIDNVSPLYQYSPSNSVASVDVFARLFDATGTAVGYEFPVNTGSDLCGTPTVAAGTDGGFIVAWSQKNLKDFNSGWDILARPFSGAAGGASRVVNSTIYGDQYLPRISSLGVDYLIVWTSVGQDGSREGVYGQFAHSDGAPAGGEFRVNTTTISQQIHPAVTADAYGNFLVVWTSFTGVASSFDLFAQRYINSALTLPPMSAPFVYVPFIVNSNSYQPLFQVSWPFQAGLPVDHYDVYVDGAGVPAVSLKTNLWTMTGVAKMSSHSFQVGYVLADGRHSPLSAPATATAWSGISYYGLPAEWLSTYWGDQWPAVNVPVAPDGPTPLQAFLTGANPTNSATWLRTGLTRSPQGYFLTWNPQPGLIYQPQSSTDLTGWVNAGGPRFAAGNLDSLYVGGNNTAYYRVLLLRLR